MNRIDGVESDFMLGIKDRKEKSRRRFFKQRKLFFFYVKRPDVENKCQEEDDWAKIIPG